MHHVRLPLQEANGLLELLDGVLIMVNCYLTLDTVHIVKELHQALVDLHGEPDYQALSSLIVYNFRLTISHT